MAEDLTIVILPTPATLTDHREYLLVVHVGVLPKGSMLLIETVDGSLVGSASFSGSLEQQSSFTLPLPSGTRAGLFLYLRVKLRLSRGSRRAPSSREFIGMEITPLPQMK